MSKANDAQVVVNPDGIRVGARSSRRHHPFMTDPCCTTMHAMSLTLEELLAETGPDTDPADVADWKPMVRWQEDLGLAVIDDTPIYFCPWCGSRLAKDRDEPLGNLRKSGILFEVSPDGTVHATIDGEGLDTAPAGAETKGGR